MLDFLIDELELNALSELDSNTDQDELALMLKKKLEEWKEMKELGKQPTISYFVTVLLNIQIRHPK
jgi:hypothetical protein